jgi:hypothetical protein
MKARKYSKTPIPKLPPRIKPPKDFDPITATNADLLKYGYPQRPDQDETPRLRAVWGRKVASAPRFVSPVPRPAAKLVHKPSPRGVELNVNSPSWSGASLSNPPEGQTFYTVSASWVVPSGGIPPTAAFLNGTAPDGRYETTVWIGLDSNQSLLNPGLSCGTRSFCQVRGGAVISNSQFANSWYHWDSLNFGIDVSPGDLVTMTACGTAGGKVGSITMVNVSQNTVSGVINISAPAGTTFQGSNAAWFVGNIYSTTNPFSNFGATFFFDTLAGTRNADESNSQEHDLSAATLLNLVNPPASATAVVEKPELLMVYAYNNGP